MNHEALVDLNNELTDAIGACHRILYQLSITPELLSVNCQNTSLEAAEAQFALERDAIPVDVDLERAIVKKEMVFVNYATKSVQKCNAATKDRVSLLRQEVQLAEKECESMKTVIDEKDEKELKYLIMKQDEYVKRAVVLKEKMTSSGITCTGLFKTLIDDSVNVSKCQAQLAEVAKTLTKYSNFPPDILEGKIKLTEAKTKFKEVDQELRQKIVGNI